MLPIGDENVRGGGLAIITLALIGINVLVFLLLQLPSEAFTYGWSVVPREITQGMDIVGNVRVGPVGEQVTIPLGAGPDPIQLTLLSSMFMHGGWLHLAGNMLFLWIFGDNVEHAMGAVMFLVFYLVAGVIGSLAQVMVEPDSLIPSLGASGAISGVLGAYLVLFPHNRVLVVLFQFLVWVPAIVAIGLWAALQFISGIGQIAVTEQTGGVAYLAHIGGFLAGLVGGFVARALGRRGR
jgi:membrane associated rhomboid family serine protease